MRSHACNALFIHTVELIILEDSVMTTYYIKYYYYAIYTCIYIYVYINI